MKRFGWGEAGRDMISSITEDKSYLHGNILIGVGPVNWSSGPVKATDKVNGRAGLPRFSRAHVWMGELDRKES